MASTESNLARLLRTTLPSTCDSDTPQGSLFVGARRRFVGGGRCGAGRRCARKQLPHQQVARGWRPPSKPDEPVPPGIIEVNPTAVHDSAFAGTFEPRRSNLEIANRGRWAAVIDSPWIGLSPSGGIGRSIVTLALAPQGLRAGSHQGSLVITSEDAAVAPVTVPITFFILQPVLSVEPKEINRTARSSGDKFNDTLRIRNTGTGPLVWTASNKSSWLTLDVVAGVGDGRIVARTSAAGLSVATYKDTIVVVAAGAYGSPAKIPVSLRRRRDD